MMRDNDDHMAIPKRKSISHHFIPSEMVCVSFEVKTAGVIGKFLEGNQDFLSKLNIHGHFKTRQAIYYSTLS